MAVFGFALSQFGFEQEGVGAYDALTARQTVKDLDSIACTAPGEYRRCFEAALDGHEDNASAVNGLDRVSRHAHTFGGTTGNDQCRNGEPAGGSFSEIGLARIVAVPPCCITFAAAAITSASKLPRGP